MNHLSISEAKIDIEHVTGLVSDPSCGATSVFIGTTRDSFDDKKVVTLEYESYVEMALKVLNKICGEIRKEWSDVRHIAIYHRLGNVPVQQASISIAISSPHRGDAIKAVEFCIDSVKKEVPIWKKEVYENETAEWKQNKESYPPKIKRFKLSTVPQVEVPYVPPNLIQIRASNDEFNKRIRNFMERKRTEINSNNIREFCNLDRDPEFTCARVDAGLQKRKDSKGHLLVSRVLNTYHRDQMNSEYLRKFMPKNGVEERVRNLEIQLSLKIAADRSIYARLKDLEDRLMYLESVSPEYINFWDKAKSFKNAGTTKKKSFTIDEIDSLIAEMET